MITTSRILAVGCAAAFIVSGAACATHAYVVEPSPEPAPVVVVEPEGPPPWAPAHGYRRTVTYRYYYYPECEVYYLVDRDAWFWFEGGIWQVGVELPVSLRVELDAPVEVELAGEHPASFHAGVKVKYPRGSGSGGAKASRPGTQAPGAKEPAPEMSKETEKEPPKGKDKGKGKGHGHGKP